MKPNLLPTHTLLICIVLPPYKGVVVAVIIWQLDLQLHITTDFVRFGEIESQSGRGVANH